ALPASAFAQAGQLGELLSKVRDKDPEVRNSARALATQVGAPAVVPLGELMVDPGRETALTAKAALERIVHHSGRPGAEAERAPVATELAKLLAPERPPAVKREVVHFIA